MKALREGVVERQGSDMSGEGEGEVGHVGQEDNVPTVNKKGDLEHNNVGVWK